MKVMSVPRYDILVSRARGTQGGVIDFQQLFRLLFKRSTKMSCIHQIAAGGVIKQQNPFGLGRRGNLQCKRQGRANNNSSYQAHTPTMGHCPPGEGTVAICDSPRNVWKRP
jgi:hypothetical protein